jgi:predicted acetyltransferase
VSLTLRPFGPADESVARVGHEALAVEGFPFLLSYEPHLGWEVWLAEIERLRVGTDLPVDRVRSAFLAADVDGVLVGRVSVRFTLNEWLAREGGHIGYAVLPEHRRRGYATAMLRLAVTVAHEGGAGPLLVVCDDDNIGSATVIERCGGVLEARATTGGGTRIRRYWI